MIDVRCIQRTPFLTHPAQQVLSFRHCGAQWRTGRGINQVNSGDQS